MMIAMIGTIAVILLGQVTPSRTPQEVNHLCGRLDYIQTLNVGTDAHARSNRRALKSVAIELYSAKERLDCCSGLERVAVVTSGKGGQFKFEKIAAGSYWMRGNWNGNEFRVPIAFQPEKRDTTECSQQGILFDDQEHAQWWIAVSLD